MMDLLKSHLSSLNSFFNNIITYCYLKLKGVDTKYGYVKLLGFPIIIKAPNSKIILKKGVTLVSNSEYNPAGINHPVILATLAENAIIEIGGSGLSGTAVCSARKIIIGDHTGLGVNSNVYDTDFHTIDPILRKKQNLNLKSIKSSPVIIGNDVWIGGNVTILKGVNIGDRAVIAFGAVVTKDVPKEELHGGIPAVKIKNIYDN